MAKQPEYDLEKGSILCLCWECLLLSTDQNSTKLSSVCSKRALLTEGRHSIALIILSLGIKNLSFLRDERFLQIIKDPMMGRYREIDCLAYVHIAVFCENRPDPEGDYLECGSRGASLCMC